MTFVIIGGGIDLSVGAIVALASVWATTRRHPGLRRRAAMVFCALLVGVGCGPGQRAAHRLRPDRAVHRHAGDAGRRAGAWPSRSPASAARSSPTRPSSTSPTRDVLGIPLLVFIFAVVVAVGWVLLNRTTFGRRTFAIGGNPEAARLAGIDVRRHTVLLYVLSGLCCGIAAIMIMARDHHRAPAPTATSTSSTRSPRSIIGGTLLTGGRGTLDRLDPRRAGLHHDHQPVHPQQPGDRGPEHRQGPDHRRRRAAPAAAPRRAPST